MITRCQGSFFDLKKKERQKLSLCLDDDFKKKTELNFSARKPDIFLAYVYKNGLLKNKLNKRWPSSEKKLSEIHTQPKQTIKEKKKDFKQKYAGISMGVWYYYCDSLVFNQVSS